ncbi:MAG: DUF6273 domain-containing protein [Oscillospiraceae bacterium]|nr:DUF6273 domain-containing protein [Oscillospiraceae bacterium]
MATLKGDLFAGKALASMKRLILNRTLRLGGLEWRCLAVKSSKALLITKDIVEKRAYHTSQDDVTWENCALREYLNGAFMRRFTAQERGAIAVTALSNAANPQFGTDGGNATKDQVFLLSTAQALQYFKSDEDRAAQLNGKEGWWWLRSTGHYQGAAAAVLEPGLVYGNGTAVDGEGGVRPALWFSLKVAVMPRAEETTLFDRRTPRLKAEAAADF